MLRIGISNPAINLQLRHNSPRVNRRSGLSVLAPGRDAGAIHLVEKSDGPEIVNVGVGQDIVIGKQAELLRKLAGFTGGLAFDASKSDGTFRKVLVSRLHSPGGRASIGPWPVVAATYCCYVESRGINGA